MGEYIGCDWMLFSRHGNCVFRSNNIDELEQAINTNYIGCVFGEGLSIRLAMYFDFGSDDRHDVAEVFLETGDDVQFLKKTIDDVWQLADDDFAKSEFIHIVNKRINLNMTEESL